MKKIVHFFIFCTLVVVALQSCKKDVVQQTETIKEIIIDTAIQAGSSFQLKLAPVWDSTKMVTIIQQANSFTISQLDSPESNTAPVYTYASSLQSGGTDQVTLAVSDLNDGKRVLSKDSTIIYVNFTIK